MNNDIEAGRYPRGLPSESIGQVEAEEVFAAEKIAALVLVAA